MTPPTLSTVATAGPIALLDAVVRDALDPSYARAAERHHSQRPVPLSGRRRSSLISAALLLAVGAIAGVAVASEQRVIPKVGAARNALAGNAEQRTRQVTDLERTLAQRQRQVAALQQAQLQATSSGRALQRQAATLSAAAAETPVRGPGIRVVVTDVGAGRATDRDLQDVVNALWAGGAEAMSVGGMRLGPQTAIRTAGQTILVSFQPLRSPYRIDVIGGPGLLASAAAAPAIAVLRAAGTHPRVVLTAQPTLDLPAAVSTTLDAGRPAPAGGHS